LLVSRSLSRWQAAVLGVVVVVALVLAGGGLFLVGDRAGWGSDSFRVVAGLPDIGGIEVGTRIRIQGIDAGEVEAILPPERPGEHVKLRLRIGGKYHHLVGQDARVQIVSESLVTGKVVRILPGAPDAQPAADGAELAGLVQPDLLEGVAQAAGKLNRLLTEVDDAMQSFRKKDGTGSITQELADSARKLNTVLAKAETTLDQIDRGDGTLGKLIKDKALYDELTGTLSEARTALRDIQSGQGTLGKLVKDNEAYSEALASIQDLRKMVASVKQNADAIKALPVVRSYVIDPNKELIRPDCRRSRKWFAETDLFEPGKAVLTAAGKKRLDGAAEWLNAQKADGSELVVASFAAPGQNADFAHTVTQKQSEVVGDYLRNAHQVHRTGWWWWSTRPLRAVGCGTMPTPVPETEKLPPARVELIVFVPQ
jgi:phospholipid/cholesterol/gamma-HCH transport system substrate-binding protein